MKTWMTLALILCIGAAVQAEEAKDTKKQEGPKEPITKEQFMAQQKKRAEKKKTEFDQAKVEAQFKKLDKNGDGKLSAEEKPARKGKKEKKPEQP